MLVEEVSYNHLIFVDISNNSISINFEMSPSQKSFPLQDAEMVGSPLLGPFPLETEGVVEVVEVLGTNDLERLLM